MSPLIGQTKPIHVLARYELIDLLDDASAGRRTRTSIGLNIRPLPAFVYKVEYSINEVQGMDDEDNTLMASVAIGF